MFTPTSLAEDMIDWIRSEIVQSKSRPPILFVSGAQGIGKTTALEQLATEFGGRIAVLGLDDFYLTAAERKTLADQIHPLFQTRGPPGTHDIAALGRAIDQLQAATNQSVTHWPRFDKPTDDRCAFAEWHTFTGRPEAILIEGWLIGVTADPTAPLVPPINRVEEQDTDGRWRAFQEQALAHDYADLWDRADAFYHIQAPSFDVVLSWRQQQEESNLGLAPGQLPEERQRWVEGFILHYERLTWRLLSGGRRPGRTFRVNGSRQPTGEVFRVPIIVFTDLDGTLLDHETYSYDAALPAIDLLKRMGAVIVLASSKTAAEISQLRDALGLAHCPAIVENGSGRLEPRQWVSSVPGLKNSPYQDLLERLNDVPAQLRAQYTGFSDWSVADIAELTGLSPSAAEFASRRDYSEPGLWAGSDEALDAFLSELQQRGVSARRGGRFLTLSFGRSKADEMSQIIAEASAGGPPVPTLALGDAPNDREMIERADYGVILHNEGGNRIAPLDGEATGQIIRLNHGGPAAWNQAVLDVLNTRNLLIPGRP